MLIERKLKVTNDNGYVYTNCLCNNSVEFAAEIPANAVVDAVKINGETLDSLAINAIVSYPRGVVFEGQTVVAIVRFLDEASSEKLYSAAMMGELTDFEVIYHEVACAEA